MNTTRLCGTTALLAATMLGTWGAKAEDVKQRRPNILLIVTDDQGYGDLGRHRNPVLKTPHLDRLGDQSVRFDDFCVSPSCSPSRCAILTGMHEFRSGVTHTILGRNRMSLAATTVAQLLRKAGYATGIFGKWHLGAEGPYRPEKRGFDRSVTTVGDTQKSHFDPVLLYNGQRKACRGYRTDILFREAAAFIEANRDRPFFCYIPTYAPHAPLKAPPDYLARYAGKGNDKEVPFFAMIANIDDNVGALMAKLTAWDLDRRTVVIFLNDNGGTHGVDLWNAGMRGCKGTAWFGGTRAMSFWRWPGVWAPKTVEALTGHVDILPTLAEIAGVELDPDYTKKLDGISLVPLLTSAGAPWPDRMLFTHMGRWPTGQAQAHKYALCAVRWRQYQLVRSSPCSDPGCRGECRIFRKTAAGATRISYSQAKGQVHFAWTPPGRWALYDVRKDPAQEHDLAADHPEIVARMAGRYDQWWQDVSEGLP